MATQDPEALRRRNERIRAQRSGVKPRSPEREDPTTVPPLVLRQHIAELTCPWCDLGPFFNLGGHTIRAHGVSARDLKVAAMVPTRLPLVAASTAARLRDRYFEDPQHEVRLLSNQPLGVEASKATPPTPLKKVVRAVTTARVASLLADRLVNENPELVKELLRIAEAAASVEATERSSGHVQ